MSTTVLDVTSQHDQHIHAHVTNTAYTLKENLQYLPQRHLYRCFP